MNCNCREELVATLRNRRLDLANDMQPRDVFEWAIVKALGEISWDEAVAAIYAHRAEMGKSEQS